MGKKARREREEKRDSYATQRGRQKRKNIFITAGILAGIAAIVGYSAYDFVVSPNTIKPPGAGVFGDEHEHASVLVKVHGDTFDFSASRYQIQDTWIHFEAQDGTTIHRHSSGVTMGYLFDTLDVEINDECFVFPDGRSFCTDDEYTLRYYIDRQEVTDMYNYVLDDGDRILITYGGESEEELEAYLNELEGQVILA